jgi:murein DD-endopeptidase MepM/ murein hydrolase activator NlpD
VAYVGEQDESGFLIVVNHVNGFQTRYAQVVAPQVSAGNQVQTGQMLGTAAPYSDETSVLYFEVRTNSSLGWVARDPGDYVPELSVQ